MAKKINTGVMIVFALVGAFIFGIIIAGGGSSGVSGSSSSQISKIKTPRVVVRRPISYDNSGQQSRVVTLRTDVRQVSPKMSQYQEQRTKLIQKLDTLRQKRNANTAAFEAAKSNLHNGGVDKLERLTNEYGDILEDMQEVKRQIRLMDQKLQK